jgi:hypothetical protein
VRVKTLLLEILQRLAALAVRVAKLEAAVAVLQEGRRVAPAVRSRTPIFRAPTPEARDALNLDAGPSWRPFERLSDLSDLADWGRR